MVECTGLENRRGATHRGFESHPLRSSYAAWGRGDSGPGEPGVATGGGSAPASHPNRINLALICTFEFGYNNLGKIGGRPVQS